MRRCSATCSASHPRPGRELHPGSALGVRPFAVWLLFAALEMFPSRHSHLPFGEPTTSIIFIEGPTCGRSFTTLRFPWRRIVSFERSLGESQPQVTDAQQVNRGRSLRLLGFLAASKSCPPDGKSRHWISTATDPGRNCLGLFLLQGFGSNSFDPRTPSCGAMSQMPANARIAHRPPASGSLFHSKLLFRSWPSSMTRR